MSSIDSGTAPAPRFSASLRRARSIRIWRIARATTRMKWPRSSTSGARAWISFISASFSNAVGCSVSSQSQKTGTAPSSMMPRTEPESVLGVQMTSSPGPMPAAIRLRWTAAEPLEQGTMKGNPV